MFRIHVAVHIVDHIGARIAVHIGAHIAVHIDLNRMSLWTLIEYQNQLAGLMTK